MTASAGTEGRLGPTVAGTWYPADAAALGQQVDAFLVEAGSVGSGSLAALIAPHAGFVYSGRVAAKGFRRLGAGPYGRVLLLGPSHYAAFSGAVVPSAESYRTPLGDVFLDTAAIGEIAGRPAVRVDDGPFRPEHSLEAEIPFLQRVLEPGWRLVPVLLGSLGGDASASTVAGALRPLVDPATVVVISSDFTHFGPRFDYVPFDTDVPRRLERLDMGAVERILDWDLGGFESYLEQTGATICGRNPIRVLLALFGEPLRGELAAYDTSGRITGEWDHSVSYASIVFRESGTAP